MKIAFFLLTPDGLTISGVYRTLLIYINLLINNNNTVHIYFENSHNSSIKINIDNIRLYNEIEQIDKCIFNLGIKTNEYYDFIVANAWQVANTVYMNKSNSKKIIYIIQDLEYLFYPNDKKLQEAVIKTYKKEYHYYCLSEFLYNQFNPKFLNVTKSILGINQYIYNNKFSIRKKTIIIAYYKYKVGRLPSLIEKIIEALHEHYKLIIFPDSYDKKHENIININMKTPHELNEYYNNATVGIVMSNTNPSRLGFEMISSGLNVIEYDNIFTKYDMPDCYFKKIKNETNILNIVNELMLKNIDTSDYLKSIHREFENKTLLSMFNNLDNTES